MKKGLLVLSIGLIMVVTSMIMGQLFGAVFPSLAKEYTNPSLFRPWSDPIMSLYFLYPFMMALVLSFIWSKTKNLFSGKSYLEKGTRFGVTYWLLTSITGMLISYSTFPVSLLMILSWSLSSLITVVVGSVMTAKLMK